MKTLLLLRHAKSSWSDPMLADYDRPLKGRGRRDAPRVGRFLLDRSDPPDLILTSPARRALETALLVAEACHFDGEILEEGELYGAHTDDALRALSRVPDGYGRVLVVGHNPCLEELWLELTGRPRRMPTAALGEVRLWVDAWSKLVPGVHGDAVGLWTPSEMDEA